MRGRALLVQDQILIFAINELRSIAYPETLHKKCQEQQTSNDLRFADLEILQRLEHE